MVSEPGDTRGDGVMPLASSLSARLGAIAIGDFSQPVVDKAKTCLYDLIGCAFESGDKPLSRQAMAMTTHIGPAQSGGATVIGFSQASSFADAAFVVAIISGYEVGARTRALIDELEQSDDAGQLARSLGEGAH